MKRHSEAMSQNPKTYFLLLCLATLSFASFGQELDSLKTQKRAFDTLQVEVLASLHSSQEFDASLGFGGQVNLYAPFYNGRLRLGLGVGFGKQSFGYQLNDGRVRIGPIYSYSAELDANVLSADLTIGTDLLPKSKMNLTIAAGAKMNYMFNGNYHFNYNLRLSNETNPHSFSANPSIHPAVIASISFDYPVSKRSSLGFSYSFSYSFLTFSLKSNTSSNGLFYQMDWYSEGFASESQDLIVALPFYEGPDDPFNLVYLELLELPSNLGGQHSFSISYQYTFGQSRKNE
jgi:hypothetical protein